MKHIPIDNNIYKFLKEIDNHYKDELIGLSCKNQISDEVISRIQKNNWNNNNTYVYVITEINKTQLQNFLSMTSICKGVAIDLYKYDDAIKIINDYAMDLNYLFYVNAAIPTEELEKNEIRYTKIYGNIYDIS